MGASGEPGRLVSESGAAFGLVPVADPRGTPAGGRARLLVDVELVEDGMLVCYLGRRVPVDAFAALADAYRRAAAAARPEADVEPVDVPGAGVRVAFVGSDAHAVTVACSVEKILDAEGAELDTCTFDVPRARLDAASHEIVTWLGDTDADRVTT